MSVRTDEIRERVEQTTHDGYLVNLAQEGVLGYRNGGKVERIDSSDVNFLSHAGEDVRYLLKHAQKLAVDAERLAADKARMLLERYETCVWRVEPRDLQGEAFDTECGVTFVLFTRSPANEGYIFCPSCGKQIECTSAPVPESPEASHE